MQDNIYKPSDLLTTNESSVVIKAAPATMRNWRTLKKGPRWVRVGQKMIRYRYADLEAFIAASTEEAA